MLDVGISCAAFRKCSKSTQVYEVHNGFIQAIYESSCNSHEIAHGDL